MSLPGAVPHWPVIGAELRQRRSTTLRRLVSGVDGVDVDRLDALLGGLPDDVVTAVAAYTEAFGTTADQPSERPRRPSAMRTFRSPTTPLPTSSRTPTMLRS